MAKTINTLAADIYEMLAAAREGRANPNALTPEVQAAFERGCSQLLHKLTSTDNAKKRTPKTLYASEVGHPCYRKLWYKTRPEKFTSEVLNPATLLSFAYGDLVEELLLALAAAAGHTVERRQERVEIPIKDGWVLTGRIDAVIDGVVIDVKSTSQQNFEKFRDPSKLMQDDPFGYVMQLATYITALAPKGGVHPTHAGFLAVDKVRGQLATPLIHFPSPLSNEMLCDLVDIVASPKEPPHPAEAAPVAATTKKDKLCTMCSYCEYKEHCWRDANEGTGIQTEIVSGKPRYIVKTKG